MKAEFGFSRRKLANGLAGAVAFVVTGLAVALFAVAAGQPLWAVVPPLLVIILFFGLVAVTYFRRFSAEGPVLTIDASGIHDRRLSPDLVPWEKVERLATVRVWGHDVLEIRAAEPRRYFAPSAALTRILAPIHGLMGLSPLLVSPADLEASFGDVLYAVQQFRPAHAGDAGELPARAGAR